MAALGLSLGLPYRGPVSAAASAPFNPTTDLPWSNDSLNRMYWRRSEATFKTASDGSGSAAANGDPIGYVLSQYDEPTNLDETWNDVQSNASYKPVLAAGGIVFVSGGFSFLNPDPITLNSGSLGATFVYRVKLSAAITSGVFGFFYQDYGPIFSALVIEPGSSLQFADGAGVTQTHDASGLTWADTWHTIAVRVRSTANGNDAYLYIDDPSTPVATLSSAAAFSLGRDFPGSVNANCDVTLKGKFMAEQEFTGDDLADIMTWVEDAA